jgi:hypothetical protein
MNWTPYLATWSFFAAIVIGLAIYRKMLSTHEDDTLHISEGGARLIPEQIAMANRLEVIDKWGKMLTVVVGIAGLILAAIYFWNVWQTGTGVVVTK